MPAAKNTSGKVYKLADVIRDVQEAKHSIVIETDDGTQFTIDPPELWDDDVFAASSKGPVEEAKAIMGAAQYAKFRKAGGRATLIQHIIQNHVGSTPVGESAAS